MKDAGRRKLAGSHVAQSHRLAFEKGQRRAGGILPGDGAVDFHAVFSALPGVALWDVEEGKRDGERRGDFGPAFLELARRVYRENDRRAAIKRRINDLLGSEIVEEKSYAAY